MTTKPKPRAPQSERRVPDVSDGGSHGSDVRDSLTPVFSPGVEATPEVPRREMVADGQLYVLVNGGWTRAPKEG